ncbi:MAG TPA: methionyl-tRNA formyltransferase [Clostridiaceae bacterium]|nr:methionyl-tRNA formyltransferase [Clostridiaceae bacterium]
MGTPEFAVPSLDMLVREGYDVAAVVTQPDKPKGRGKKLAAPPVKEYALEKGIEVLQPEKVKTADFVNQIRNIAPDLLVTAAYGKILSKELLDVPPLGCINVHASLLPKYRGAAPINWCIINGEKITGVTTMFTDEGMDTGDMLLKRQVEITDEMTVGELHDILSLVGAEVLKETLIKLKDGTLQHEPQNHEEATYAPMIDKTIGEIDWNKPAQEIHNLVRGTNPWPGAYTFYKGDRMKVWKTRVANDGYAGKKPGTICKITKEELIVATGDGFLSIIEVQFDSGRKMGINECGHNLDEGEVLG